MNFEGSPVDVAQALNALGVLCGANAFITEPEGATAYGAACAACPGSRAPTPCSRRVIGRAHTLCSGGRRFLEWPILDHGTPVGTLVVGPVEGRANAESVDVLVRVLIDHWLATGALSARGDLFARVARHIDAHLTDDLSISALTQAFFVSRNALMRAIKAGSGLSLGSFIKARRLQYAERLLVDTDLPISQIAEQCGILDFNYFARVFKRRYDQSPREYRRSHARARHFV